MPPQLRIRKDKTPGQKWVSDNYDLKQELEEKSGGTMPFTPAFTTTAFPNSDVWSESNPPEIIFYIKVPASRYNQKEVPPPLRDAAGSPLIREGTTEAKRYFEILPDRISIDVPGWLIETWRRLDPRIRYQDIIDRMTSDLGSVASLTERTAKLPSKNILQNHCRRNCRKVLGSYTDYHRRSEPHRVELLALDQLCSDNITYNTILPITSIGFVKRIVKASFHRRTPEALLHTVYPNVTFANMHETTFPLHYFTIGCTGPFTITRGMDKAWESLLILQERAQSHGLGLEWQKLPRECLPVSWYDRTAVKTIPNPTFDGGCEICSWKDPQEAGYQPAELDGFNGSMVPVSDSQVTDLSSPASDADLLLSSFSDFIATLEDFNSIGAGLTIDKPDENNQCDHDLGNLFDPAPQPVSDFAVENCYGFDNLPFQNADNLEAFDHLPFQDDNTPYGSQGKQAQYTNSPYAFELPPYQYANNAYGFGQPPYQHVNNPYGCGQPMWQSANHMYGAQQPIMLPEHAPALAQSAFNMSAFRNPANMSMMSPAATTWTAPYHVGGLPNHNWNGQAAPIMGEA